MIMYPVLKRFDGAVLAMAARVWGQGWDESPEAPETFIALREEYARRNRITVFNGASDLTIYGEPAVNIAFRAWHDWCHLAGGHNFSVAGETAAAEMQCNHLRFHYGMSEKTEVLCALVKSEVIGQADYYARTKQFVKHQRPFVLHYMAQHFPREFVALRAEMLAEARERRVGEAS